MEGPRDWSPEEPAAWFRADEAAFQRYADAHRNDNARRWSGGAAPHRRGGAWGRAIFALILGIAAIWSAVTPLLASVGGAAQGYVLSSIGAIAVLFGVNALRRNRVAPNLAVFTTAVAGIGTGVIGTIAMVAVMVGAGSFTTDSFGSPAMHVGEPDRALAQGSDVQLSATVISGAGRTGEVVLGNGGSVRLGAGYSVRTSVGAPAIELRLERRAVGGPWSPTGVTTSISDGSRLSAVTPPYATTAPTELLQYRFASAGSDSSPVSVLYENQRFYTGMAATIYGYAAPYCPTTAVHVTPLSGREAGEYSSGGSLILIDSGVGVTANLQPAAQRSVAIHECSHELQWLNYGSTQQGRDQMTAAAATYFSEGANGAPALEHAADCGAMAAEPNGYLGYGGYCTPAELHEAARLLGGDKY